MRDILVFSATGLGQGAVFAALALGLVVIYKGTGVINFAMGAMAMWGAFVYDELRDTGDLVFIVGRVHLTDAAPVALTLGILSSAALGGLAHLLVFRPLRRAPVLAKVVASLGLLVTLQALVAIRLARHLGRSTRCSRRTPWHWAIWRSRSTACTWPPW